MKVRSVIKFLKNKRREMLSAGVVLLHDNARPHMARRSTHILLEFSWEVFNHPSCIPDLAFSEFHLLLHLKKFLSGQCQRFQNDREAETSVTQWFQPQAGDFYDTGYKSWTHDMTNVSIPEVNMLKNSSTLAVSVAINLCIKLGFVSVNILRETYFVDVLRIIFIIDVSKK